VPPPFAARVGSYYIPLLNDALNNFQVFGSKSGAGMAARVGPVEKKLKCEVIRQPRQECSHLLNGFNLRHLPTPS